jgi:hypothetical protein
MMIPRRKTWIINAFTTITMVMFFLLISGVASAQSLSEQYPLDEGIENAPEVLYFQSFDDETETKEWTNDQTGLGWTSDPDHVFQGTGALEVQHINGEHYPHELYPEIAETDVAYVRWYRKWQSDYEFAGHKMPGVYAYAGRYYGGGAGEKPDGYDKFSCKLYVTENQYPRFYTYHPDQQGPYGDMPDLNLVNEEYTLERDRWYCFEMMIKANNPPEEDGEIKMWIDGELVAHHDGMRFRDTSDLKINTFTYSAYVGGDWTAKRTQNLWDDQIVVATTYIGPISSGTSDVDTDTQSSDDYDNDSTTDSSSDELTDTEMQEDSEESIPGCGENQDVGCE